MAKERLQKILAQAGIASRRRAEDLIREGAVTVNGRVAVIGEKADLAEDAIKVSGKLLQSKRPPMYLAFNKPRGVISMFADPEGRPTLADFLTRVKERLFPIGRLDFNSEGLILLTNDGAFSEKLQHRSDIPRVYHVKVRGHTQHADLERLERGARLGDKLAKPHSVRLAENLKSKSVIEWVTLESGALDVKAAFETRGFQVEKITRTAIGHITLKGLAPGEYRMLKASQVEALLNQPELGMRLLDADAEAAVPVIEETAGRAEAPEREEREERPRAKRGFGAGKPSAGKRFGAGKPFGEKREGLGKKRSFGAGKSFGEKRSFGAGKSFGEKRSFGAGKPFGEKRSFGAGKSFGEKRPFGRAGARSEGRSGGLITPRSKPSAAPAGRAPRRIRVTRKRTDD